MNNGQVLNLIDKLSNLIRPLINDFMKLDTSSKISAAIVLFVIFVLAPISVFKFLKWFFKKVANEAIDNWLKQKRTKKKSKKDNKYIKISLKKYTKKVSSVLINVIWGLAGYGKTVLMMSLGKEKMIQNAKLLKKLSKKWYYTNPTKYREYIKQQKSNKLAVASNVEVSHKGKTSQDIEPILKRQVKATPFMPQMYDEVGEILGKDRYHNRTLLEKISDNLKILSLRYGRHDHGGNYYFTEQDGDNIGTIFGRFGYNRHNMYKKPKIVTKRIWKALKYVLLAINWLLPAFISFKNKQAYERAFLRRDKVLFVLTSLLPTGIFKYRKKYYYNRKDHISHIFKFLFQKFRLFVETNGVKYMIPLSHWQKFDFNSQYHQAEFNNSFNEDGTVKKQHSIEYLYKQAQAKS